MEEPGSRAPSIDLNDYRAPAGRHLVHWMQRGSGGSIVNHVTRAGKLIAQHSGAVNISSTPNVRYVYSERSGGRIMAG